MQNFIVVDKPQDWPLQVPGAEVVSARAYLTEIQYRKLRNAKVFNLCRSYRYQTIGYYVSLLAAARGHKPIPDIATIQDMKSQTIVRLASDELDELIQKSLAGIKSETFTLSIYFGRNVASKYDRLSYQLFKMFHAPLLRAQFTHNGRWHLQRIGPISASDIPEDHTPSVVEFAQQYFAGRRSRSGKRNMPRYDLAILVNPEEPTPPSNERALQRFLKAAETLGLSCEMIQKDDYARIAEFDALFIRETTSVNHHTYRFARRAAAEGLVVIDDPESILRCTNKVYLAELLDHHGIAAPKTFVVSRDSLDSIAGVIGFPCILKQPDSSFSQGVVKADDARQLRIETNRLFEKSDLVIAQEFLPTAFDWRVGIFDQQPIYVCRYHMAPKHWQITHRDEAGRAQDGKVDTMLVEEAPKQVVKTALRAANLIGNGLYGVDLKQAGERIYVIEINDNPSIDAGYEDAALKQGLYMRIMEVFLRRIKQRKEGIFTP